MLVFDDDTESSEGDYDDVYSTVKRVQEIIDRRSAEFLIDDCGKLSETLSKLVTCTRPKVMRLWSENPKVCGLFYY